MELQHRPVQQVMTPWALRKKTPLFVSVCFPCVCPEPVLAKRTVSYENGAKKAFSAPAASPEVLKKPASLFG
jgi:hypothetical protein